MDSPQTSLTTEQHRHWDEDGFFFLRGYVDQPAVDEMRDTIVQLARMDRAGGDISPSYVQWEQAIADPDAPAEDQVSKLFRVHRGHTVFNEFCRRPDLLDMVGDLLAPELDCFLSQFIFKLPGAIGQPWHQDAFYFPFSTSPQVGVWIAVTEATEDNGPLWVVPGSHRGPVHEVMLDERPEANFGYVEIVEHDTTGAIPVLMQPGDALVFHSNLVHRSTDNESDRERAAMVFHYAIGGTDDHSEERFGFVPPNIDWMPVRRVGE